MSSPSSQCAEEDWGSGMEAYFSDACCYEEVSIMGVLVAMALVLSACVFYRFRYHKDEECCRGMRNAWNATASEAQQDSSAALTHETMITNPMALSGMLQVQATILDSDEEDGDGSTPTVSVEIPEMLPAETRRRGQQATSGAPERGHSPAPDSWILCAALEAVVLGFAIFLTTGVAVYDLMGFDHHSFMGFDGFDAFVGFVAFCVALVRVARGKGWPLSVTLCCPAYATPPAPESDLSLSKGDRVTWTKSDDDVPIGSVGDKGPCTWRPVER
jgi:hypothetical protein